MAKLLVKALDKYLRLIFTDFSSQNVNSKLLRGRIELNNIGVNTTLIEQALQFPNLKVTKAHCSDVKVNIPWKNINTKPITVAIGVLTVVAEEPLELSWCGTDLLEKLLSVLGEPNKDKSQYSGFGFLERTLAGVRVGIDKIIVQVHLQGSGQLPFRPPNFLITLNSLQLFSTNRHWQVAEINRTVARECKGQVTLFKVLSIDNISLHLRGAVSEKGWLQSLPNDVPLSLLSRAQTILEHKFLSLSLKVFMSCRLWTKPLSLASADAVVAIPELQMIVRESSFSDLVYWSMSFAGCLLREQPPKPKGRDPVSHKDEKDKDKEKDDCPVAELDAELVNIEKIDVSDDDGDPPPGDAEKTPLALLVQVAVGRLSVSILCDGPRKCPADDDLGESLVPVLIDSPTSKDGATAPNRTTTPPKAPPPADCDTGDGVENGSCNEGRFVTFLLTESDEDGSNVCTPAAGCSEGSGRGVEDVVPGGVGRSVVNLYLSYTHNERVTAELFLLPLTLMRFGPRTHQSESGTAPCGPGGSGDGGDTDTMPGVVLLRMTPRKEHAFYLNLVLLQPRPQPPEVAWFLHAKTSAIRLYCDVVGVLRLLDALRGPQVKHVLSATAEVSQKLRVWMRDVAGSFLYDMLIQGCCFSVDFKAEDVRVVVPLSPWEGGEGLVPSSAAAPPSSSPEPIDLTTPYGYSATVDQQLRGKFLVAHVGCVHVAWSPTLRLPLPIVAALQGRGSSFNLADVHRGRAFITGVSVSVISQKRGPGAKLYSLHARNVHRPDAPHDADTIVGPLAVEVDMALDLSSMGKSAMPQQPQSGSQAVATDDLTALWRPTPRRVEGLSPGGLKALVENESSSCGNNVETMSMTQRRSRHIFICIDFGAVPIVITHGSYVTLTQAVYAYARVVTSILLSSDIVVHQDPAPELLALSPAKTKHPSLCGWVKMHCTEVLLRFVHSTGANSTADVLCITLTDPNLRAEGSLPLDSFDIAVSLRGLVIEGSNALTCLVRLGGVEEDDAASREAVASVEINVQNHDVTHVAECVGVRGRVYGIHIAALPAASADVLRYLTASPAVEAVVGIWTCVRQVYKLLEAAVPDAEPITKVRTPDPRDRARRRKRLLRRQSSISFSNSGIKLRASPTINLDLAVEDLALLLPAGPCDPTSARVEVQEVGIRVSARDRPGLETAISAVLRGIELLVDAAPRQKRDSGDWEMMRPVHDSSEGALCRALPEQSAASPVSSLQAFTVAIIQYPTYPSQNDEELALEVVRDLSFEEIYDHVLAPRADVHRIAQISSEQMNSFGRVGKHFLREVATVFPSLSSLVPVFSNLPRTRDAIAAVAKSMSPTPGAEEGVTGPRPLDSSTPFSGEKNDNLWPPWGSDALGDATGIAAGGEDGSAVSVRRTPSGPGDSGDVDPPSQLFSPGEAFGPTPRAPSTDHVTLASLTTSTWMTVMRARQAAASALRQIRDISKELRSFAPDATTAPTAMSDATGSDDVHPGPRAGARDTWAPESSHPEETNYTPIPPSERPSILTPPPQMSSRMHFWNGKKWKMRFVVLRDGKLQVWGGGKLGKKGDVKPSGDLEVEVVLAGCKAKALSYDVYGRRQCFEITICPDTSSGVPGLAGTLAGRLSENSEDIVSIFFSSDVAGGAEEWVFSILQTSARCLMGQQTQGLPSESALHVPLVLTSPARASDNSAPGDSTRGNGSTLGALTSPHHRRPTPSTATAGNITNSSEADGTNEAAISGTPVPAPHSDGRRTGDSAGARTHAHACGRLLTLSKQAELAAGEVFGFCTDLVASDFARETRTFESQLHSRVRKYKAMVQERDAQLAEKDQAIAALKARLDSERQSSPRRGRLSVVAVDPTNSHKNAKDEELRKLRGDYTRAITELNELRTVTSHSLAASETRLEEIQQQHLESLRVVLQEKSDIAARLQAAQERLATLEGDTTQKRKFTIFG